MKLEDEQKAVLAEIAKIADDSEITLIGGVALRVHEIITRETHELDLVIRSPSSDPSIKLARADALERVPKSWVAWRHRSGVELDLIPFHGSTDRPTTLTEGFKFSSVGLDTVHETAIPLAGIPRVKIAHPAYLAVMKMGAFRENPSTRQKDLGDIASILAYYGEPDDERLWGATVGRLGLMTPQANAFLCGLDTAALATTALQELARRFAEQVAEDDELAWQIADLAPSTLKEDDDRVRAVFEAYVRGLTGA